MEQFGKPDSANRNAEGQVGNVKHEEHERNRLHVIVHFVSAARPFHDEHADPHETLGHLKSRVLASFNLVEGPQPNGAIATYTIYHNKTLLENMSETLGAIEGGHKELQLKLCQQLTQGSRA